MAVLIRLRWGVVVHEELVSDIDGVACDTCLSDSIRRGGDFMLVPLEVNCVEHEDHCACHGEKEN